MGSTTQIEACDLNSPDFSNDYLDAINRPPSNREIPAHTFLIILIAET